MAKKIKHREDIDLLPDVQSAIQGMTYRYATIMLVFIAIFLTTFVGWAYYAKLDEVTRGDGRVIPSRSVQVIQNLEGGIVAEILVRDGEVVDAGQVLLRIDNTVAESDFLEKRAQYLSYLGQAARLKAESEGAEAPDFPAQVIEEAPGVVADQLALFESRKLSIANKAKIYQNQEEQKQLELRELQSRASMLNRSYGLVREELDITKPLLADGAVSRVDVLQLERQANDLRTELESARLSIPRLESALAEASQRIEEVELDARAEARLEFTKTNTALAALQEILVAEKDRVLRTEVRAPLRGIVKDISVTTVGGVIQPGEDLVQIVPLEDTLVVEAHIKPHDVAFLSPGQKAKVKISAYDFAIYGGLDAIVEHISADTLESEENPREDFYLIRLRTDRNYLGTEENPLPIIPGMTATVDILTGEKTVLAYLMKPILRARYNALSER
ncbi:MAG: HlyD family type I secretion periplasmic adaptor subunit [Alphaproteobacteria bacterium]|nr:HlyD family type I secretion periplasmic adaptor subunit [Alphaproteobacteria bacterium]